MEEEKIIRDEATYFSNRYLRFSTDVRAIEQFRLVKTRLEDFYSPAYKAIFLDQIESLVNEKFVQHCSNQSDIDAIHKKYFERLLFYIQQELNTLPALARQKTTKPSAQVRDQVFVSYSPADKSFLEEIKKHFKPFADQISFWDNDKILPGQNKQEAIEAAISKTKVAILLLSADFLASDTIVSNELPSLLKIAENEGAVILTVILKPCLFEVIDELNQYQTMNPANVPLLKMDQLEREELYVNLVRQTKRILSGE